VPAVPLLHPTLPPALDKYTECNEGKHGEVVPGGGKNLSIKMELIIQFTVHSSQLTVHNNRKYPFT
jgi:hypothetical protein